MHRLLTAWRNKSDWRHSFRISSNDLYCSQVNGRCCPQQERRISYYGGRTLREKKGYFYAVLNYTDAHGNRKTKWIATGLAVKGNKKRAEAFLQEQRRSFQEDVPITGDVLLQTSWNNGLR